MLGGFSMGTVMSYALGLGAERRRRPGSWPSPASSRPSTGWAADLDDRPQLPVFIAHGRARPVIDVEFARRARTALEAGGLPVEYHESDLAHQIDVADIPAMRGWLGGTLQ